jgi:holo-[acyl-carrier protein] synthase
LIIGVGIDIVDLDDFRARLSDALLDELVLPSEVERASSQARPWESYGARFAAKEAAFKALGAGLSEGLRFRDVEVVRGATGEVTLRLLGRARDAALERGVTSTRVSLSHSATTAVAVVIAEGTRADGAEGRRVPPGGREAEDR